MSLLKVVAYESISFSTRLSDKEVRQMVKSETACSVRRLDNFTLISLNTVFRLVNNNCLSSELALYSSAEYLSVDLFQSVITSLKNDEALRPFDFIATVGNAANFYLAKEFNVSGPNVFIGASQQPFFKSALLAQSDLNLGHAQQAIIVVWHCSDTERVCHAFAVEKSLENKIDIQLINVDEVMRSEQALLCPLYVDLAL